MSTTPKVAAAISTRLSSSSNDRRAAMPRGEAQRAALVMFAKDLRSCSGSQNATWAVDEAVRRLVGDDVEHDERQFGDSAGDDDDDRGAC